MNIYLFLLLLSCGVHYISAGIDRQSNHFINGYQQNNDQIKGEHVPPIDKEVVKNIASNENKFKKERLLEDILGQVNNKNSENERKKHQYQGSARKVFMAGKKSQSYRNVNQRLQSEWTGETVHEKRVSEEPVFSLGVDPDLLLELGTLYKGTPRENKLRDGAATDICLCNEVSSVPSQYRDANYFYKPVPAFYQKFTECYGIPILGSNQVTDEGLKRACYDLKFLLSGRYDLRNMYYKFCGRICVIAKMENVTDLPEYSNMDVSINTRSRGLGPTVDTPITSAGDENMRCDPDDRYLQEDILIHEFAHAIHRLGAAYVIEGFNARLNKLYTNAMAEKKYHIQNSDNTFSPLYACENMYEYWAQCSQIYYESFQSTQYTFVGKGPGGSDLLLHDRDTLKYYDQGIVDLMDEVYPCENYIINRCAWKDCSLDDSFTLIFKADYAGARAACTVIKSSYSEADHDSCAAYTCLHQGNAFNYQASLTTCEVLNCPVDAATKVPTMSTIPYEQGAQGGADIYAISKVMDLTLQPEASQSLAALCAEKLDTVKVNPTTSQSMRCTRNSDTKLCGPTPNTDSQATCEGRGCCYDSTHGECYYAIQSCSDHSMDCKNSGYELEPGTTETKCAFNPAFMLRKCPLTCNMCEYSYRVWAAESTAAAMCQDYYCFHDKEENCDSNLYAIQTRCPIKCNLCTLASSWKSDLNIDDFSNWKET